MTDESQQLIQRLKDWIGKPVIEPAFDEIPWNRTEQTELDEYE